MSILSGNDDTNSIKPTEFDLSRLDDLQIGESFEGELGNWKILRYKNDYTLILFNHPTKRDFAEFVDKKRLINYLKN